MFHFYTSWKCKITFGFPTFSAVMQTEHWAKIDQLTYGRAFWNMVVPSKLVFLYLLKLAFIVFRFYHVLSSDLICQLPFASQSVSHQLLLFLRETSQISLIYSCRMLKNSKTYFKNLLCEHCKLKIICWKSCVGFLVNVVGCKLSKFCKLL